MGNPIIRGFGSIFRFGGRDTRSQFWPFAAVAVALYFIVGMPIDLVAFPDDSGPGTVDYFLLATAAMFVALVALLAAAVARRLHDSGLSAYWGLLPLPFATYCGVMFERLDSQFEAGQHDMRLFFSVLTSDILYFIATVWLIVLLIRRSASGPNRFG